MMQFAFSFLNLKPEEFWNYTIAELNIMIDGFYEKQSFERKQDLWLAWHIEAFHRKKKLPKLQRVMSEKKTRKLEGEELERRKAEFEEAKRSLPEKYKVVG